MARSSGDPDALLAALPPRIRDAVLGAIELLELGPNWHEAPAVARFVEYVAFAAEVDRIRGAEGVTGEAARNAAGIRLGVNNETIDRQLRDQRRRSRRNSPGSSAGGAVTVIDHEDPTTLRRAR
jgi:hypothetical protein